VKIEDWSNTAAVSPDYWVMKAQSKGNRQDVSVLAALGDNPDLSFLDLLTQIGGQDPLAQTPIKKVEAPEKSKDDKKASVSSIKSASETQQAQATQEAQKSSDAHHASDAVTMKDLLDGKLTEKVLLMDDLTDVDQNYIRERMIPNLPILMGQVPADSVFPKGRDGGISYQGFEISDGLADMIKHGYRTGQPIRLELDANSSLVLRIRNGQVSAEFVAADQGAALAMQNDLNELRQRMAARNLPVGNIESRYKDQPQSNQDDRQQKQDETPQNSYE